MEYIHVKVKAGMARESWQKKSADHFEVSVREKAERNLANIRVIELASKHLNVPLSKIRIVNGHRHPSKLLAID